MIVLTHAVLATELDNMRVKPLMELVLCLLVITFISMTSLYPVVRLLKSRCWNCTFPSLPFPPPPSLEEIPSIRRRSCVTSESGLTAACQCRHMLPKLSQGVLLYCVNLTASVARSAGARESLIGLVVSLVLTRLDYCNAVLAGLPAYQLDRLQSAINAAARMILPSFSV